MNSQVYLAHMIGAGRVRSDRDHAQLRQLELSQAAQASGERSGRALSWWRAR